MFLNSSSNNMFLNAHTIKTKETLFNKLIREKSYLFKMARVIDCLTEIVRCTHKFKSN
jgi:hypothetical protein